MLAVLVCVSLHMHEHSPLGASQSSSGYVPCLLASYVCDSNCAARNPPDQGYRLDSGSQEIVLLVFILFRGFHRFRCKTGLKTVWGRNLAENDAKLRSQNESKSVQNRYLKLINILIDFLNDCGPIWEAQEIGWTDFELN